MDFFQMLAKSPLYIKVSIMGYKNRALIDTGATNNIISISTIKKMNLENYMDTSATSKYSGVCGQEETTLGKLIIKLHIAPMLNIYVTLDVIKDPVSEEYFLLLGRDFLTENRCIIDFSKFSIKILDIEIKFLSLYEDDLSIPNNSELMKLINYINNYKDYLTDGEMCIFVKIIKDIENKTISWNQSISTKNVKIGKLLEKPNGRSFIELLGFEINDSTSKMELISYDSNFFEIIKNKLIEVYDC